MKHMLLRVVTAFAVAAGLVVPATAPARADVTTVIAVIKQIYSLYQQFLGGGSGGLTLAQAVAQIEAEIQTAETNIINQIDLVAAANVQGCATSAVVDYADINALSPTNLQAFALDATSCVTQAQTLINAVTDKGAIDELGFAMNIVAPIALTARLKAGLTDPALTAVVVAGENSIITDLLPVCQKIDATGGEPGAGHFYLWDCVAYNGTEVQTKPLVVSQNDATAGTSRAVAQAALPILG